MDQSQLTNVELGMRNAPVGENGDDPLSTQHSALSTVLCGVRFPNPTVLASGILGLSEQIFVRLAQAGAGGITTKSCSLKPRTGWPNPTIVNWGAGLINAVGLSNPGVEVMVEEVRAAKALLAPYGVPIIASIFANTIYDYGVIARYVSEANPDLIEVNISFPISMRSMKKCSRQTRMCRRR